MADEILIPFWSTTHPVPHSGDVRRDYAGSNLKIQSFMIKQARDIPGGQVETKIQKTFVTLGCSKIS